MLWLLGGGIFCAVVSCAHIQPASVWYKDFDEDGYSDGTTLTRLEGPRGYFLKEELLALKGDCDDADATVHPGTVELSDGVDNDCNGQVDDGLTSLRARAETGVDVPAGSVRPGEPLWVTARFVNNMGKPIRTIRPDCFNTTFTVQDGEGRILPPQYRIRKAYGIPDDVVTLPPGMFTVRCDLSEMHRPDVLTSGPGGAPVTYRVKAVYANTIQDPDIVPVVLTSGSDGASDTSRVKAVSPNTIQAPETARTGECTAPKGECYPLWTGALASHSKTLVTIEGSKVDRVEAELTFDPAFWHAEWAALKGGRIKARVRGEGLTKVESLRILLNGKVPPIAGSVKLSGDELTVHFDASEAVRSLDFTPLLPGLVYPTVDIQTSSAVLSGKAPVQITSFDLNGDGKVDKRDLEILGSSLGKCKGTRGYLAAADYDGSGCNDREDYRVLSRAIKPAITAR